MGSLSKFANTVAIPIGKAAPTPEVALDRRALERSMAKVHQALASREFGSLEEANEFLQDLDLNSVESTAETPEERAKEILYDAFAATNARRVQLAKQALEVFPDSADAYVLLAEDAETYDGAIELYRKAVEAGLRALPENCLDEWRGSFWSRFESRPYMRAKAGLAEALLADGQFDEAVKHFQEILSLNPNDNQGVRYDLAACLLADGRDSEVRNMMEDYSEDPSAFFDYANALMVFRTVGPGAEAEEALIAAFGANPHVPVFLVRGNLPETPDSFGFGDESEAVVTIHLMSRAWLATRDYLPWLMEFLDEMVKESERGKKKKHRR